MYCHPISVPQEYKEAFEPLVLEECAAQIMRGVEEGEVINPHPCVVSTHENVSGVGTPLYHSP